MANRNDPSSLSFGARLKALEKEAAVNQRRVQDLEGRAPSKAQQQDLKEQRAYRRQERARANQLIASYDSTAEDFDSLDRSTLTKAQAELVNQRLTAARFAEASPKGFQLTPKAGLRLQNWREAMASNPGSAFAFNNLEPEQLTPTSAFGTWTTNVKSEEDVREKQWRDQLSTQKEVSKRRNSKTSSKTKRFPKGGIDFSINKKPL